ncbi:hypothetical protein QTP88_001871 [Uroleucon formosanum]
MPKKFPLDDSPIFFRIPSKSQPSFGQKQKTLSYSFFQRFAVENPSGSANAERCDSGNVLNSLQVSFFLNIDIGTLKPSESTGKISGFGIWGYFKSRSMSKLGSPI